MSADVVVVPQAVVRMGKRKETCCRWRRSRIRIHCEVGAEPQLAPDALVFAGVEQATL